MCALVYIVIEGKHFQSSVAIIVQIKLNRMKFLIIGADSL